MTTLYTKAYSSSCIKQYQGPDREDDHDLAPLLWDGKVERTAGVG